MTSGEYGNALLRALEDPPYGRHLTQAKVSSSDNITLRLQHMFNALIVHRRSSHKQWLIH